jgi:hypothetical protein
MAILGKGPGPKKKDMPKSKIGGGTGRTVAAPGYAMGLMRNQKTMSEPTKKYTTGTGPAAVTRVQQQGIIGPKPTGPGGKATAAPASKQKRSGKSDVGRFISKVGDAMTPDKTGFNLKRARRTSGRGNKGGGPLKCFRY